MKLRHFHDKKATFGTKAAAQLGKYFAHSKTDPNVLRRYIWKERKETWYPCRKSGNSMGKLIEQALNTWRLKAKPWKIEMALAELGAHSIMFREGSEIASIELIREDGKEKGWRIVLNPARILTWPEDLGHEIGHLEAIKLFGSQDHPMRNTLRQRHLEEVFSEEFGLLWASDPYHRREVHRLLARLRKL